MPSVQFGHMKRIDLSEVTKFSLVAMRSIIDRVKKMDPDKFNETLPDIHFQGEERKAENVNVPQDFKVLAGGKG